MKKLFRILAFAAVFLAASAAQAVPAYGDLSGGVYYGSGNVNGNWTIDNGVFELGLRAKDRSTGNSVDGSSGVYYVPKGVCNGVGICSGTRQYMTYDFSVMLNNGSRSSPLTPYTFRIGVDHDPTAMTNFTFVDAQGYWADEKYAVGFPGFQNSQNVGFADTPGGMFDPTVTGLFDWKLQAWLGQEMVQEVTMRVQIGDGPIPVSEPGSLALLGAGLAGMMVIRRKKGVKPSDSGMVLAA